MQDAKTYSTSVHRAVKLARCITAASMTASLVAAAPAPVPSRNAEVVTCQEMWRSLEMASAKSTDQRHAADLAYKKNILKVVV